MIQTEVKISVNERADSVFKTVEINMAQNESRELVMQFILKVMSPNCSCNCLKYSVV